MRILHLVSNFRWTERIEPARRARMSAQAAADARARFSRTTQAQLVLEFYERLRRLRNA